jgi:hypothetical protein
MLLQMSETCSWFRYLYMQFLEKTKLCFMGEYPYFRNKQYQLDTHFTFHFIEVHSLDMFRALLANPQEAQDV